MKAQNSEKISTFDYEKRSFRNGQSEQNSRLLGLKTRGKQLKIGRKKKNKKEEKEEKEEEKRKGKKKEETDFI